MEMQINVAQLLKASIGTKRTYEVDEVIDFTGESTGCQVHGEVSLTRTNRGILADGTLHTHAQLDCSRCLTPFDFPLTIHIEEEYIPEIDVVTGLPLPSPEEPGTFTIDKHHILDLTEAIRQHALLAIPMKPLCREDCPGLCPQCGKNLAQGPCGCPTETINPRWSELTKLL